jgi:phosphoribosylformylglycinamidine cyclo-ligase
VNLDSFRLPPLFRFLADSGPIAEGEMLRTFNCGVGLIAVVAARDERTILETLSGAFRLGEVTAAADPPRVRYRGCLA